MAARRRHRPQTGHLDGLETRLRTMHDGWASSFGMPEGRLAKHALPSLSDERSVTIDERKYAIRVKKGE